MSDKMKKLEEKSNSQQSLINAQDAKAKSQTEQIVNKKNKQTNKHYTQINNNRNDWKMNCNNVRHHWMHGKRVLNIIQNKFIREIKNLKIQEINLQRK